MPASGESEAAFPQIDFDLKINSQPLNILCCNIRSVLGKIDQLVYLLNKLQTHFVLLQETWLDASVEALHVPGYVLVSRRDRSENENRGGVLALCRVDVKSIVLLFHAPDAERS